MKNPFHIYDRREYLYCFAARKVSGLINSSARIEGLNDHLVSRRQKNKGMSWSVAGLHELASLAMLTENNELSHWMRHGEVRFGVDQAEMAVAC